MQGEEDEEDRCMQGEEDEGDSVGGLSDLISSSVSSS